MSAIAVKRPEAEIKPGPKGFESFCRLIGFELEPFMRRIIRAYFSEARMVCVVIARGNYKSTLASLAALHHLLCYPAARVLIAAMSREQGRIVYERMRGFAQHPALEDRVAVRHLELRYEEGWARVAPADGGKIRGQAPTLMIGDEVQGWREGAKVLEAMEEALIKEPDSKVFLISNTASSLNSPLGVLRSKALAQDDVRRRGVVTEARGEIAWLEWSIGDDDSLDDMRRVKQCNPARYIAIADLRRQRSLVAEQEFAQFHAGRWGAGAGAWLPPTAWRDCQGHVEIEDGERIFVGIDVGGSRSDSAVCWITEDGRIGCRIFEGADAVLDVAAFVPALAERYHVVEITADPWRTGQMLREWEQRGLVVSEFPQMDSRLAPATTKLYDAIVNGEITHPGDPALDEHIANTITRSTRRGVRIDKLEGRNNDGAVALAMANDRRTHYADQPPLRVWSI